MNSVTAENVGVAQPESKTTKIIVNGREKEWPSKEISFNDLVTLAFGAPPAPDNWIYNITYTKGPHDQHKGVVSPGETVKIKDGEVFNVTRTNKS